MQYVSNKLKRLTITNDVEETCCYDYSYTGNLIRKMEESNLDCRISQLTLSDYENNLLIKNSIKRYSIYSLSIVRSFR